MYLVFNKMTKEGVHFIAHFSSVFLVAFVKSSRMIFYIAIFALIYIFYGVQEVEIRICKMNKTFSLVLKKFLRNIKIEANIWLCF